MKTKPWYNPKNKWWYVQNQAVFATLPWSTVMAARKYAREMAIKHGLPTYYHAEGVPERMVKLGNRA